MNASVTIRLSELGSPARDAQSVGSRDVAEILETEVSDEALMAGVCEGNMEALASLFRRHARTVRAVSYRVLRDSCEADDLVTARTPREAALRTNQPRVKDSRKMERCCPRSVAADGLARLSFRHHRNTKSNLQPNYWARLLST